MKSKRLSNHPHSNQGKMLLKIKNLLEQRSAETIFENAFTALTLLRGLGLTVTISDLTKDAIVFEEGYKDHPNGKEPFILITIKTKVEHAEMGYVFLEDIEKDVQAAFEKGLRSQLAFTPETVQGLIEYIKKNC